MNELLILKHHHVLPNLLRACGSIMRNISNRIPMNKCLNLRSSKLDRHETGAFSRTVNTRVNLSTWIFICPNPPIKLSLLTNFTPCIITTYSSGSSCARIQVLHFHYKKFQTTFIGENQITDSFIGATWYNIRTPFIRRAGSLSTQ